ncbi:MAG: 2-oxoacid:acceptor oxidoreductase family protein [bacterium]|nr:2-oxoacid:acceptor oxidoreductase family protein [bacterium]
MNQNQILPITNESGYYEIRLESIGGLGANLCAKMLGELGLTFLGCNSACFSSYGSEKTGTPVKGYIRYCKPQQEIRTHAPVEKPHLLAIFHEALLDNRNTIPKIGEQTKIVLSTRLKPEEAAIRYQLPVSQLYCVPAQQIAMDTNSRINVVMLGAIGSVMGFVQCAQLEEICKMTLGKKYPDALMNNLSGVRMGFSKVICAEQKHTETGREALYGQENPTGQKNATTGKPEMKEKKNEQMTHVKWGYQTAPIGGINPWFGNSVTNDLSPSRQGYIPIFIKERCINCALCDVTCPDMVFRFEKGVYKGRAMMVNQGLDYVHCKGCMRCVTICPSNALVSAKEEDYREKPYDTVNRELICVPAEYEERGADAYITSEAYLTEKRMDGGEV